MGSSTWHLAAWSSGERSSVSGVQTGEKDMRRCGAEGKTAWGFGGLRVSGAGCGFGVWGPDVEVSFSACNMLLS